MQRRGALPRATRLIAARQQIPRRLLNPNALSQIFFGFVVNKFHAMSVLNRTRKAILLASTTDHLDEVFSRTFCASAAQIQIIN
jgi:hypothetical protein